MKVDDVEVLEHCYAIATSAAFAPNFVQRRAVLDCRAAGLMLVARACLQSLNQHRRTGRPAQRVPGGVLRNPVK
jgi:hypothetical protein